MVDSSPLAHLQEALQRPLTKLEQLVLEASWQGQRYRQMAAESGYGEEYIKQVGSKLWAELSEKTGNLVTKKICAWFSSIPSPHLACPVT
ncbi:MAG: hypothetical protein HC922_02985 [Leptolyngbyaceae cyanobacterium SM2_3_12]|nr:hypothetical protein [Leptolyngbyaceae cyanobacterium SM2_3_12]